MHARDCSSLEGEISEASTYMWKRQDDRLGRWRGEQWGAIHRGPESFECKWMWGLQPECVVYKPHLVTEVKHPQEESH